MTSVLITGATGKQGGSLINALLNKKTPYQILAVTRDASSGSAQRLLQKSPQIKLVEGNLDNPAGIFQNARKQTENPIWGVFSVQAAMGSNTEERQGKAIIDESIKQGVKYFIYSSVDRGGEASANNPTNIPHFIKKHNIEQHLFERAKNGKMDWTVLRPVAFFDNFAPGYFGKVFNTCWRMVLKGKPLQLIATSDIGYFGAEALLNPEAYKGKAISLAGDELTFDRMAQIYKEKTGNEIPTTFQLSCSILMAMMKDFGIMFKWFHDEGYKADISELKKVHPGLKDFSSWLETDSGFVSR